MVEDKDMNNSETSVMDVQGGTLFDRISDYITEKDWSFTANEDMGCLSFGLRLCDGTVRVVVDATEGVGWSTSAASPLH
jgi:hypothetical protein